MAKLNVASPDLVRKLLRYDENTGKLFWLVRDESSIPLQLARNSWNTKYAGKEAFTAITTTGYYYGNIEAQKYPTHRVAWCLYYGKWPEHCIDHINGDKLDNRIVNLRDVPQVTNNRNSRRPSHNKSGVVGVFYDKANRQWQAQISLNNHTHFIGRFDDLADAAAARKAAEAKHGFHANHGR